MARNTKCPTPPICIAVGVFLALLPGRPTLESSAFSLHRVSHPARSSPLRPKCEGDDALALTSLFGVVRSSGPSSFPTHDDYAAGGAFPPIRSCAEEDSVASLAIYNDGGGVASVGAPSPCRYEVEGIQCKEVCIELPIVGHVAVLEATAESQEMLVDMALILDEDDGNGALTPSQSGVGVRLAAGDPYGAVLWPSASAVARYLLLNVTAGRPKTDGRSKEDPAKPLRGLTVVEIGAGTGLVSVAAALGGADRVIATDYELIPLALLKRAVAELNPGIPSSGTVVTRSFDLSDASTPLPEADVVVAADVLYEPKMGRAMARRAAEALRRGSRFVLGDSPGRPGRPSFMSELERLVPDRRFVFRDTVGYTCSGERHELICGAGSQSISKGSPKPLNVAILDLLPDCLS